MDWLTIVFLVVVVLWLLDRLCRHFLDFSFLAYVGEYFPQALAALVMLAVFGGLVYGIYAFISGNDLGGGGGGGGGVEPEPPPDDLIIERYCQYGAVSRAQLNGCLDHVTVSYVRRLDTNASDYAFLSTLRCRADAGPFCVAGDPYPPP